MDLIRVANFVLSYPKSAIVGQVGLSHTRLMKSTLRLLSAGFAALAIIAFLHVPAASQQPATQDIRYTADGKLEFPENFREWIFLSAGRGMTYGPSANPDGPPQFDNVFVNPAAYRAFMTSGRWPEQSIFVLEIRKAKSEGSINKGGQFQGDTTAVEVLVKDSKRFADTRGWGFFEYDAEGRGPVAKLPKTATCYGCHAANGAVEHTFVQFYPTLLPVAAKYKTLRAASPAR